MRHCEREGCERDAAWCVSHTADVYWTSRAHLYWACDAHLATMVDDVMRTYKRDTATVARVEAEHGQ